MEKYRCTKDFEPCEFWEDRPYLKSSLGFTFVEGTTVKVVPNEWGVPDYIKTVMHIDSTEHGPRIMITADDGFFDAHFEKIESEES